ncbi:MAG: hypothetical protein V1787_04270 [Candidatus Micrarchaeota archaeon]
MFSRNAHLALLSALMVASTAFVWLPFLQGSDDFFGVPLPQTGMDAVKRYWDGPLYVIVSRTFYSEDPLYSFGNLPRSYYAAHLALYPASIRLLSVFSDAFDAMLLSTLLFSVLAVCMFYLLVKDFRYTRHPFLLSVVFIFLPARWLVYHSVGATEPAFVFLVLASLYLFKKGNFLFSAAFASLAAVTRVTGVLLFAFYLLYFLWKRRSRLLSTDFAPYLLIPAALCLHFLFYSQVYGDFFAYGSVNNYLLSATPFRSLVSYGGPAQGEYWLFLYALYAAGIAVLYRRRHHDLALLSLVLALPVLFISHNDIARYLLPVFPFALVIAFEDVLTSREFRPALLLLLVGAYMYAWGVIPNNLMPADEFARLSAMLR